MSLNRSGDDVADCWPRAEFVESFRCANPNLDPRFRGSSSNGEGCARDADESAGELVSANGLKDPAYDEGEETNDPRDESCIPDNGEWANEVDEGGLRGEMPGGTNVAGTANGSNEPDKTTGLEGANSATDSCAANLGSMLKLKVNSPSPKLDNVRSKSGNGLVYGSELTECLRLRTSSISACACVESW